MQYSGKLDAPVPASRQSEMPCSEDLFVLPGTSYMVATIF